MTAYLEPGDKVFIASGVKPGLSPEEYVKAARELNDSYISMFEQFGVTVVATVIDTNIAAPEVFAVIRGDAR